MRMAMSRARQTETSRQTGDVARDAASFAA